LQQAADALSVALKAMGVRRGDRVAIVLPQRFETAVAYMALLQMGAVAMPLSVLFGPEALVYRLQDSEAVAAIADGQAMPALQGLRDSCPALRSLIGVDGAGGDVDWAQALASQSGGRSGGRGGVSGGVARPPRPQLAGLLPPAVVAGSYKVLLIALKSPPSMAAVGLMRLLTLPWRSRVPS
jgi:hypothetical protein